MDKYYFQARFKWSKVFGMLNDTEIGRLTKAVWHYAETGEALPLPGKESVAFAMIIADLDADAAKREAISNARRDAINHRWNRNDTNVSFELQNNTTDSNNNNNDKENDNNNDIKQQLQQNAGAGAGEESGLLGFLRVEKQSRKADEMAEDVKGLFRIQEEHNTLMAAAEEAGFGHSSAIRDRMISLYAEFGLEKVLYGINECVTHGACTIAYLTSVCKGGGKKPVSTCCVGPRNPAANFQQRKWEDDPDEMERFMAGGQ